MGQEAFTSASKKDALKNLDEKIKELEKEKERIKQIEVMEPIKIEIECEFERNRNTGIWGTHVEVTVTADIPPNLSEDETRTRLMLGFQKLKKNEERIHIIDEYEDNEVSIEYDDECQARLLDYGEAACIEIDELCDELIKNNGCWSDSGNW